MYYLRNGLGYKRLGSIFAVFTVIAAVTVGNFAQVNSVLLPLEKAGMHPLWSSLFIAILVGLVILGGVQRVAKVAAKVVPMMALMYIGAALVILAGRYEHLLPSLWLMIRSAFDASSVVGGVAGYGIFKTIAVGFERGLFATDAGTGTAPILQSSARTDHPVKDGIVTLIAPLLVMLVCTVTGLVLITTGAWEQPELRSTNMVIYAFEQGLQHHIGGYIVLIALALFAYTTIIAWASCAEKAVGYLAGTRYTRFFQWLFLLMIPAGTLIHMDLIWTLADISISLMLITNIIAIAGLSKDVIGESRQFFTPVLKEIRDATSASA